MLGLCGHGLPATHNLGPSSEQNRQTEQSCFPQPSEPIESWRALARVFRSILNIAAEVHDGRAGNIEDWSILYPRNRLTAERNANEALAGMCKFHLARVISRLLRKANLRPELRWDETGQKPRIGFAVSVRGELFGILTLELALAVCGQDDFVRCQACGIPYTPQRLPKHGQRNYCETCRSTGAPARHASRVYRQRRRKEA
jgi:hypothetical protein